MGDTKALDAAPKRLAWLWAFALVILPGGVSVGLILAMHSKLPALLAVPLAVAFGWLCANAGGDLGSVLTIAIAIPLVALIAVLQELLMPYDKSGTSTRAPLRDLEQFLVSRGIDPTLATPRRDRVTWQEAILEAGDVVIVGGVIGAAIAPTRQLGPPPGGTLQLTHLTAALRS